MKENVRYLLTVWIVRANGSNISIIIIDIDTNDEVFSGSSVLNGRLGSGIKFCSISMLSINMYHFFDITLVLTTDDWVYDVVVVRVYS